MYFIVLFVFLVLFNKQMFAFSTFFCFDLIPLLDARLMWLLGFKHEKKNWRIFSHWIQWGFPHLNLVRKKSMAHFSIFLGYCGETNLYTFQLKIFTSLACIWHTGTSRVNGFFQGKLLCSVMKRVEEVMNGT